MHADFLDLTKKSYCATAFAETADELIHNAEMQLIGQQIDFDSMVGIGNSGLLVMPILARHFKVPFFAMRKAGSSHHNSKQPYGDGKIGKRWIMIDDVSITGNSIKVVKDTINKISAENDFTTEYVGTYLYEPINPVPGEFIYPDDRKNSVQRVGSEYVSYGLYAKVKEVAHRYGGVVESTVTAVMRAYPHWDAVTVRTIANTLTQ